MTSTGGGWFGAGALAALTAAGVAAATAAPARAQTMEDIRRLDRLSEERGEAVARPGPDGKPRQSQPPSARPEQLRPLRGLWVCSGAVEHTPVLTEPRAGAPAMGRTVPWVATTGDAENGYVKVLHTNGHIGWVPERALRPFRAENGSAAQCTVAGVRPDGTPQFSIR